MANDKDFFVGQKAFIEKDGQLLVLFNEESKLDLPGGKIQEGENDLVASLKREVKEETNLDIEIGQPFTTWYYDFGPQYRHVGKRVFIVGYKCKYVSGKLKLSNEHTDYRWVDKNTYTDLDNNRKCFLAIKKNFSR